MLTKLYRFGPSRQRLRKGFLVAGDDPTRIVESFCQEGARAQLAARARGLTIQRDPRAAGRLWLDTGLVWLHSAGARAAAWRATEEVVAVLASEAKLAGATLLPNAIRPAAEHDWRPFLCSDLHAVEASGELEKAAYCNLLRLHLPELIALTGRAGVGPSGVEAVGSRRLCDSDQHLAARSFASVSPRYLDHLQRTLLRDEGVKRLDLLDVDPGAGGDPVELRFVDGQILARTAFAQGLIFQALLIRARRLVSGGRGVRNPQQRVLEQQRSLVIAHGPAAVLFEGSPPGGNGAGGGNAKRSAPPRKALARERLLALIEDLRLELIALEASYEELAPLVLGASLRAAGVMGLENETDLVREALGGNQGGPGAHLEVIEWILTTASTADNPLTRFNEQRFAREARTVREAWDTLLTPPRWEPAAGQGLPGAAP